MDKLIAISADRMKTDVVCILEKLATVQFVCFYNIQCEQNVHIDICILFVICILGCNPSIPSPLQFINEYYILLIKLHIHTF